MRKPAVFLDRDGTLIEEVDYLTRPDQVILYPETPLALQCLCQLGYSLVLVSNQSGVARGKFSEKDIQLANQELARQLLEYNIVLDGYYFCPHHEDGIVPEYSFWCECRKPKNGMITRAASDLNIDLSVSWIIGDKISDILTGKDLGLRGILVRTGHGLKEEDNIGDGMLAVNNILDAAQYIVQEKNRMRNKV